ncbi:MAG: DUF3817 domain-containing protein [Rhodococcus sp.]|nr:DUF3817 domain-containing protein [Rhodococcus sp. (in: high G+C Gram-positive bacteria)]
MSKYLDVSTPAKRFRLIAIWEAVTWAVLLVAMFFKWVLGFEEAVRYPGMLHGVAGFVPFVLITLITAGALGWNFKVTFWALVSSVPPFGTIVFERWAVKNGHLAELSREAGYPTPGDKSASTAGDKSVTNDPETDTQTTHA